MTVINKYSLTSLSKNIDKKIQSGDLDRALRDVYSVVERLITEPICTAQAYGAQILDDLCEKIGEKNLSTINAELINAGDVNGEGSAYVYVVTKLLRAGGHIKVVEDFISANPDAKHVVLSTELIGRSDPVCLKSTSLDASNVSVEYCDKGSYLKKLSWLQRRLLEISSSRVYLFNHHQDSVAVAAIQPEMKLNAYFYHHGDHHLCLGVYLRHLKHIDPHPMGYHNCRDNLGIDNVYMPLVVDDKGLVSDPSIFRAAGMLTTCTSAKSNKIEVPYYVNYVDVVPALLSATGGRHVHIGRLTPWALFNIRLGLRKLGVPAERFIYKRWVPSVWQTLVDEHVDIYVASFPYGGGLTLIEAMGAGVPVILHKHLYSSVLSGIDLGYENVPYWSDPDELFEYCATLSAARRERYSRLGRLQYEKYHRREILADLLSGQSSIDAPRLAAGFSVRHDEWVYWLEGQITIKHIVKRFLYRVFRMFRAL